MNEFEQITFDPRILGGQACIRGMRIPVATIVRCLVSGMTTQEIIDAYPELEREDIAEAPHYAAELTEDRLIPISSASGA